MLGNNRWWTTVRKLFSFLMAAVLTWGLVACSSSLPFVQGDTASGIEPPQAIDGDAAKLPGAGQLSEVAPPPVLQNLSEYLDAYQPQVTIVSPNADQVLQDTTVSVEFQVQDLPVFKDPDLGLGPHLHVILDNQPYQAVYNLNQPLVLENLAPGTHTLRVFASRPWHESFKNEGAYAQTTFHVFSSSNDNNPDPALPLLTYSRPTGSYGAEPIMLDFYLTNAPLHLVAQENPDDDLADWRIRVTLNGESFVLDRWGPVYLKGFKPGKNWVKLEFLDEQGNPVKNVFNETARVISYAPQGKDTLSQLVRGELSAEAARGIVDPNYKAPPTPTPSPTAEPSPSLSPTPSPTVTPEPIPFVAPAIEATPTPEPETPSAAPIPPVELLPTPEASPTQGESLTTVEEPTATDEPASTAPVTQQKGWFQGLFNRFRRPETAPSPAPERLEPEAPSATPELAPAEPEQTPEPETSPTQGESPSAVEEPTPAEASTPTTPSAPPASPEVLETPSTEPTFVPETPESPAATTPQPEASVIPSESPADVEEATPTEKATSRPPATIINSWFQGLFNRFRPPAATPSTAPELLEPEAPLITPELAPAEPETSPTQGESPAAVEVPTPTEEATPIVTPSAPPVSPEAIETPSTAPTVVPDSTKSIVVPETLESPAATTPQPEEPVIVIEPPVAVEEPTPADEPVTSEVEPNPIIEPVPVRAIQPEESKADGLLPTLPEIIETPSPEVTEPEADSALPEPAPELSPATPKAAAPQPESTSDTVSLTTKSESLQISNPE